MLAHLRQHVAAALAAEQTAIVAADGPAGLQALQVACAAEGLLLLLLVPRTADLLLNLEADGAVIVTSARWQVWGRARVRRDAEVPASLAAHAGRDLAWYAVVAVRPSRVAIGQRQGWGAAETVDLDDEWVEGFSPDPAGGQPSG